MERADLIKILRETGCAEEHGGQWLLIDPQWSAKDRARVDELIASAEASERGGAPTRGWLGIPTGGTTGGVRFARHDERTLSAAVEDFCRFFSLDRVNVVDVLPPFHVSGLMSRIRSFATGGQHRACLWRQLEAGERPAIDFTRETWVISLVPTQLQRLLVALGGIEWLRGFHSIFIGGGPVWPELTEAAAAASLPIALTYGMTETAAMVAGIKPVDVLAGECTWAEPFPRARVSLSSEDVIQVDGPSVFLGYWPDLRLEQRFDTADIGRMDSRGRLQVLGRRDAIIITGGKKVQPADIEVALRATGQFLDVAVIGLADREWGRVVVACYPKTADAGPDFLSVQRQIEKILSPYQRPKRYVAIDDWPRTEQGKLNRSELLRRVEQQTR